MVVESSEQLWGQAGGWGHRRELPGSPLLLIKSTCESYRSPWSVCPCMGRVTFCYGGTWVPRERSARPWGEYGGVTGTASPHLSAASRQEARVGWLLGGCAPPPLHACCSTARGGGQQTPFSLTPPPPFS